MSSRAVILIWKGIIERKLEIPLIKLAFPRSSPTPAISPLATISSIHGIYLGLWHNKCNKNLSENLTLKEKTWDSHWKRNVAKKWWGKSKSNDFVIRNTETLLLYLILLPARNHQQWEAIQAKFKKKMSYKFTAPASKIFANHIISWVIFSILGIHSFGLLHATREILKKPPAIANNA